MHCYPRALLPTRTAMNNRTAGIFSACRGARAVSHPRTPVAHLRRHWQVIIWPALIAAVPLRQRHPWRRCRRTARAAASPAARPAACRAAACQPTLLPLPLLLALLLHQPLACQHEAGGALWGCRLHCCISCSCLRRCCLRRLHLMHWQWHLSTSHAPPFGRVLPPVLPCLCQVVDAT